MQTLLEKARATAVGRSNFREVQDEDLQLKLKLEQAERLIAKGELSHAARLIKSVGVAPGNHDTLAQLTDPSLRPAASFQLDRERFARNLRKARRGLCPGLADTRNDHLKTKIL